MGNQGTFYNLCTDTDFIQVRNIQYTYQNFHYSVHNICLGMLYVYWYVGLCPFPYIQYFIHILEYQNQNTINNLNWEFCKKKTKTNSIKRIAHFQGNLMQRTQHRKTCIRSIFPGEIWREHKKLEKKKSKGSMHTVHTTHPRISRT